MRALLIVTAAVASLAGSGIGWFMRGLVADHIQIPALTEQMASQCELVTEKAAADAVASEQLRQFKIAERTTQRFIDESRAAADDARAKMDVLELEIEHYVQRTHAHGGFCALDADALELLGLRETTQPYPAGGR